MDWYIQALSNYAKFSGRARRKEYWMFVLFSTIFSIGITILDYVLGTYSAFGFSGLFSTIYGLGMAIPSLSVAVRRLHDVGKSGYMLFILLIPIIGAIWILVLLATDGVYGKNEYGENPKEVIII